MRKLAILGIIVLIAIVVVITIAATNAPFRDGIYNFAAGTLLMPIHDFVVTTWISVGQAGFTWIAVTSIIITVFGVFFGYFICYGLLYKKVIQGKILHTSPTHPVGYQSSPTQTIPITGLQSTPTQTTQQPSKDEVV